YLLGHSVSVATGIGFIALAGVAAEFGVVMLIYLNESVKQYQANSANPTAEGFKKAIHDGAVLRVRPKAMTVTVIIAGLLPLFWGGGTGSEVMQRIAAPMVGGMLTAPLLSMIVLPALYWIRCRWRLSK
ncbi:MAG: efflux RND transporter permease subunit, partial [Gammaproteobacteria bacterium]|nr:efflux RND transporter permease subunit [Gammaproteobacteria bacterium]